MMKNISKLIILSVIVFGLMFINQKIVFAVDCLEVLNEEGLMVDDGANKVFVEDNAYPGWSKSKEFIVKNKCDQDAELVLEFSSDDSDTFLADVMQIIISKGSDNIVSGYTLASIRGERLSLGDVPANSAQAYKLKISFDPDAGNEYQRQNTSFNLDYQLTQKSATTSSTIEDGDSGKKKKKKKKSKKKSNLNVVQNYVRNYLSGNDVGETSVENDKNVVGVESDGNDKKDFVDIVNDNEEGKVAGVETCSGGWPLWVWIILVLVYVVANILMMLNKNSVHSKKHLLFWTLIFGLLILVLWYYFDSCRNYRWVPISTIVIAIISTLKNRLKPKQQSST